MAHSSYSIVSEDDDKLVIELRTGANIRTLAPELNALSRRKGKPVAANQKALTDRLFKHVLKRNAVQYYCTVFSCVKEGTKPVFDFRKLLALFAVLAAVGVGSVPLVGCNTVEGIGQDTRALGRAITGSAEENKNY